MTTISASVLKGLSTLLPEEINFVCLVDYCDKQYYLALGRVNFFFIDETLDTYLDPPIPYQKIEAVCLCQKYKTLIQIRLKQPKSAFF